ncbi:hypothetical protein [Salinifilum ghardaiensis]
MEQRAVVPDQLQPRPDRGTGQPRPPRAPGFFKGEKPPKDQDSERDRSQRRHSRLDMHTPVEYERSRLTVA